MMEIYTVRVILINLKINVTVNYMLNLEEKNLIKEVISTLPKVHDLYIDDSDAMFLINTSDEILLAANELVKLLEQNLKRKVVIKLLERTRSSYQITLLL